MSGSEPSAGAARQEITQRRRGEEALARWEAIVQSTREAMMTIAIDGVITSWNPGAERIFGYAENEVVGRVVGFALAGQDQNAEIARISEIIQQGRAIDELETTRRTKDGRIIDISFSFSPLRDPDGQIVGTTAIGRDITEHKRAQARLADAEERLRAAFDEASIGMVLLDADGRYVKVNDAFCAIVGYPKAHIEGSHFAQLAHPDDVEQGLENLRKLLASGRSYTADKRFIHSSGQHVHAIVHGTLLHGPDGAVRDILYEVEDVTARRRQEQQLRAGRSRCAHRPAQPPRIRTTARSPREHGRALRAARRRAHARSGPLQARQRHARAPRRRRSDRPCRAQAGGHAAPIGRARPARRR